MITGLRMTQPPSIPERLKGEAWHNWSAEEVLAHLGSSATGLSAQKAAQRLAADGPNELKEDKRISPLQIFLGQFKSLIVWILIVAGVISGMLGEVVDASAILTIVVLNAVIGFYQEFNAEKSIAALKKMTAPQAKVRRDVAVLSRKRQIREQRGLGALEAAIDTPPRRRPPHVVPPRGDAQIDDGLGAVFQFEKPDKLARRM